MYGVFFFSLPTQKFPRNGHWAPSFNTYKILAWENSRHFATPPLVSPLNDVWETSAEIPYWWRVTTHIWVVLLIGRAAWEICFNQPEAYQISLVTRHQYGISALVSQTSFRQETSGDVAKSRLFQFLRLTKYAHPFLIIMLFFDWFSSL